MENRRGQGLSITTIVIIILAIVVLVFLVYGFSVGWNNLFDRVENIGGGAENVASIVQACSLACSTNSQFDYCSVRREVTFGDDRDGTYNCKALEGMGVGLNCDTDPNTGCKEIKEPTKDEDNTGDTGQTYVVTYSTANGEDTREVQASSQSEAQNKADEGAGPGESVTSVVLK